MSLRVLLSVASSVALLALLGYLAAVGTGSPERLPLEAAAVVPAAPASAPSAAAAPAQRAPGGHAASAGHGRAAVSAEWVSATAARVGVPVPALRAYATAQLRLAAEQPECHVGWTTLAGIGWVESQHGGYGGRTLGVDGRPSSPILGPTLDGSDDVAAIPDEEGGWAQAAGPMQFIPSTWARWGADGDEDGVVDVEDLDDAAYAAARYLCASGSLASGAGWARAVFSYNHSQAYVDQVYAAAQAYAGRTGS